MYNDVLSLWWALYYIEQSKSFETHKGYESHLNMYIKWCLHYNMVPFPYHKVRKLQYTSFRARHVSINTVKKDNTVLEYYNNKYGYPSDKDDDALYNKMMEGIKKCYGAYDRDPRVPILWEDLAQMQKYFDLKRYDSLVIYTSFVVASQACLRVEELYPNTIHVNANSHDRSSIRALFGRNFTIKYNDDGSIAYIVLTLRATKNDKRKKPIPIAMGYGKWPVAPIQLMLKYLTLRMKLSKKQPRLRFTATAPLFQLYDGTILTQSVARKAVKYAAKKIGMPVDNVTLYGFRYGTATSLARRNVDPSIIKTVGRWHTDAYKSYVKMDPNMIVNLMKLYQTMPIVNNSIEFTHEGNIGFEHIPQ